MAESCPEKLPSNHSFCWSSKAQFEFFFSSEAKHDFLHHRSNSLLPWQAAWIHQVLSAAKSLQAGLLCSFHMRALRELGISTFEPSKFAYHVAAWMGNRSRPGFGSHARGSKTTFTAAARATPVRQESLWHWDTVTRAAEDKELQPLVQQIWKVTTTDRSTSSPSLARFNIAHGEIFCAWGASKAYVSMLRPSDAWTLDYSRTANKTWSWWCVCEFLQTWWIRDIRGYSKILQHAISMANMIQTHWILPHLRTHPSRMQKNCLFVARRRPKSKSISMLCCRKGANDALRQTVRWSTSRDIGSLLHM